MKILICDPIHPEGVQSLRDAGFEVDEKPTIDRAGLLGVVRNYDAVVVRGRTKIDAGIIESAPGLKFIGRAGVGLDNVDVKSAKQKGVVVLNTPAAPSNSVTVLTIGLMLSLLRKIPFADRKRTGGRWVKNQ